MTTDTKNVTIDVAAAPASVVGIATKTKKLSTTKIAGYAVASLTCACVLFGSGFAVATLVHLSEQNEIATHVEVNLELINLEQETEDRLTDQKASTANHSAPHYIKPVHTVWHNGTELQGHVVVKLVDDHGVVDGVDDVPAEAQSGNVLPPPNDPELPSARRLASVDKRPHATLVIGGLRLDAKAIFPTHRRRKLQATYEPPRDPLHLFFELDAPDGNGAALCDQLNADPNVEIAYLAPVHATLPTTTTSDGTVKAIRRALASKTELRRMLQSPSFEHLQGYRGPAPDGFDFDVAETYTAGKGAGITVADIEGGANLGHEDLGMANAEVMNSMSTDARWIAHGTAVWGEIKGEHDSLGVRGGAVSVTPVVANVFNENGGFISLATVIADTADRLEAGDVMLIEQHYSFNVHGIDATYCPVEYYADNWAAIRAAADKGIIVIEAGANGHMNLDAVQNGRFQRGHANFADSGAIMVGGARHNQRTWIGSSYGSRIDVQGWYDWSVATTGYGDIHGSHGSNDAYTSSFSGTSSASPLVTAAAAVMQSVARQSIGRVLEPTEMRDLMVQTGTSQPADDAATHPIGPQPNLKWALAALSNEQTMHGGCCQRSLTDSSVAPWEYLNGVPVALESKTIGCNRGVWMPHKTYSPATETCEDRHSFEVVSGSSCTVRNQCVYSNLDNSRYSNHADCRIRQKSSFALQVHSFDVEYNRRCSWDSLTVNGRKFCGTAGPQGVTPVSGSELVWHSDYVVTRKGFQICPQDAQITTATLEGSTYAGCQGTYAKSEDTLNGKAIWDRTTGSRFIFWCGGKWRITGSQWRQSFLDGNIRHCGAFISSAAASGDGVDYWWAATWSNNGAGITASP